MRGSEAYCEKKYAGLEFKELEAVWKSLKADQKTARRSLLIMEDEDWELGEVTKEDLETEIQWVESRLAGMQRAASRKIEKNLNYQDLNKPNQ